LAKAEQDVDEHTRAADKATRDRDGWRRKVADLEHELGCARQEAQQAEHRLTDAEKALAEQRLRAAQVRLVEENSGLSG
jgi:peptidoglycan hydrolase CwlO-like protein